MESLKQLPQGHKNLQFDFFWETKIVLEDKRSKWIKYILHLIRIGSTVIVFIWRNAVVSALNILMGNRTSQGWLTGLCLYYCVGHIFPWVGETCWLWCCAMFKGIAQLPNCDWQRSLWILYFMNSFVRLSRIDFKVSAMLWPKLSLASVSFLLLASTDIVWSSIASSADFSANFLFFYFCWFSRTFVKFIPLAIDKVTIMTTLLSLVFAATKTLLEPITNDITFRLHLKWKKIFEDLWNYPNCIGAMDGKQYVDKATKT